MMTTIHCHHQNQRQYYTICKQSTESLITYCAMDTFIQSWLALVGCFNLDSLHKWLYSNSLYREKNICS